jgi:hypothetical protein
MAAVLTKGSSLVCAHTGEVTLSPGQKKLTIGGQAVLVDGDLNGAAVSSACTNLTNSGTGAVQCSMITSTIGGVATKLTVGGKGALLESIQGLTNGIKNGTPQTWSVKSAGQTKLTAV